MQVDLLPKDFSWKKTIRRPEAVVIVAADAVLVFGVTLLGWRVSWITGMLWAEYMFLGFWTSLRLVSALRFQALLFGPFIFIAWAVTGFAFFLISVFLVAALEQGELSRVAGASGFASLGDYLPTGWDLAALLLCFGRHVYRTGPRFRSGASTDRCLEGAERRGCFAGTRSSRDSHAFDGSLRCLGRHVSWRPTGAIAPLLVVIVCVKLVLELGNLERSLAADL